MLKLIGAKGRFVVETRKIAAILVADVVGYSRLAGADEDRTLSRLRGLRSDLIDPAVDAHHGRIVKRAGDGSLIEFRSVVDAVRCAVEVQTGLIERNAGVPPERRIEFRVGIHLGDVVKESDGDLMGYGVNIAARLEGICEPGAIALSEQAYWQVKGRLDLAAADLGPTQLKNIAEPIRVYSLQVGVPAQAKPATEAAPATQAKPPQPKRPLALAPLAADIAALLILIAGGAWWFVGAYRPATVATNAPAPLASNAPPPLAAQRLSIVVLPFANLSGDPAQDYLADALTDELTTDLAGIPNTFVIARNTAFTFKGKNLDAKEIGKELGVRYVLEGSVQPTGGKVRVNAQLVDADSGAHLWAEQFDTTLADLEMHDEIVAHLTRAMEIQLTVAEAARLKRTPAENAKAEDLALQCLAASRGGGFIGKDAEAGYRLCEQALAVDPQNVSALVALAAKFWMPVAIGRSADPLGDLKRGDDLVSRALALDPNSIRAHLAKATLLQEEGRLDEAVVENERALAMDPDNVDAFANLGADYLGFGQFEKSLEFFDKAIRFSPNDPALASWYHLKSADHFGLKRYDQAIESARRAIAINPNTNPWSHLNLIAALALAGHEAEAHEALQRYLASVPSGPKTIAAWKAFVAQFFTNPHSDPRYLETVDRYYEGLRKAGAPEE